MGDGVGRGEGVEGDFLGTHSFKKPDLQACMDRAERWGVFCEDGE